MPWRSIIQGTQIHNFNSVFQLNIRCCFDLLESSRLSVVYALFQILLFSGVWKLNFTAFLNGVQRCPGASGL